MTQQPKKLIKLLPEDTISSAFQTTAPTQSLASTTSSLPSPPKSLYEKKQPPSLRESEQPRKSFAIPDPLQRSHCSSLRDLEIQQPETKKNTETKEPSSRQKKEKRSRSPVKSDSSFTMSPPPQPKRKRKAPSPLSEITLTADETTTAGESTENTEEVDVNLFNSKKERNKFLSKILLKSKKKIYKLAGCFLTPFLLLKLIMPDLPFF